VTLKFRKDLPSLRSGRVLRDLVGSLAGACERGDFRVVHYSIHSNRALFLVEAAGRDALGCGMKSLAARFARAVNRGLARKGPVLGDRYDVRVLRSPREVRDALVTVLAGTRALRGTALAPASSARWFDGWAGPRAVPPEGTRPVAAPHTWLLRVGWRRHGLISPSEVPSVAG